MLLGEGYYDRIMDENTLKQLLNKAITPLREDIKELKEDMSTLKGSVITIEQTITSYADSYKINQHNIERLDTRLSTVEKEANIIVAEDLKVPHFSTE